MAIDLELQALPESCPLFAWALTGSDLGELIEFLPGCLRALAAGERWRPWPPDRFEEDMLREASSLLARDPDLHLRRIDLGRNWDSLHFLLSPARRESGGSPNPDRDPAALLLYGAQKLGPLAKSTQGFPLRWTPASQVRAAYSSLSQVTGEQLAAAYAWEKMNERNVYKHPWQPEHAGKDRAALVDTWDALRRFYADAVASGYGVLHVMD